MVDAVTSTPSTLGTLGQPPLELTTSTPVAEEAPATAGEESLHEWVVYDPSSTWWSASFQSTAWRVMWAASFVFCAALMTGALVAASFSAPWTIVTTVGCLWFFLEFNDYVLTPIANRISAAVLEAKEASAILREMEKIPDDEVAAKLQEIGIDVATISSERAKANPVLLKPLLARLEYAERHLEWAKNAIPPDAEEGGHVKAKQVFSKWKMYLALTRYLIQHPHATSTMTSPNQHQGIDFGDNDLRTKQILLLIENTPVWTAKNGDEYTYQTIQEKSVSDLASAFVRA